MNKKLLKHKIELMLQRDKLKIENIVLLYNTYNEELFIDVYDKEKEVYLCGYVAVEDKYGDIGIFDSYLNFEDLKEIEETDNKTLGKQVGKTIPFSQLKFTYDDLETRRKKYPSILLCKPDLNINLDAIEKSLFDNKELRKTLEEVLFEKINLR